MNRLTIGLLGSQFKSSHNYNSLHLYLYALIFLNSSDL